MRGFTNHFKREDWLPFNSLAGFVRIVLCVCWDPIGIFGHRNALDEYDSYVAEVCELLRNGATSEELKAHLLSIESESMGIRRRADDSIELAVDKLLKVYRLDSAEDD